MSSIQVFWTSPTDANRRRLRHDCDTARIATVYGTSLFLPNLNESEVKTIEDSDCRNGVDFQTIDERCLTFDEFKLRPGPHRNPYRSAALPITQASRYSTTIPLVMGPAAKRAMEHVPNYYYPPNSPLSIHLPEGDLPVTIVRVFTPFTMQRVLVVQTAQDCPGIGILSETYIICKVYDPRFYPHRYQVEPYLLWNYATEVEAAEQRRKRPPLPISEFEPWPRPDDDDAVLVGWEGWYYQNAERAFYNESVAYQSLVSLQGSGIPRCFGTGTLTPPDARTIVPRVLLLEYLPDEKLLSDVDPSLITPSLMKSLIDTVDTFGPLGVVHDHLNPGNILFVPGDNPTRAVSISGARFYVRRIRTNSGRRLCGPIMILVGSR